MGEDDQEYILDHYQKSDTYKGEAIYKLEEDSDSEIARGSSYDDFKLC